MDDNKAKQAEPGSGRRGDKNSNTPQPRNKSTEAAVELIRQKVEAAYGHEPSLEAEVAAPAEASQPESLSQHQHYARELTVSGMSLAKIHEAWHDYYANLSDEEKHEVWREFYRAHGQDEHYQAYAEASAKSPAKHESIPKKRRPIRVRRPSLPKATLSAHRLSKAHLHSLLVGLAAGSVAVIIILFGFFNERFIAPFIQPSRSMTDVQLISDSVAAGPSPEIIIPKINVEIPVVYGTKSIDEATLDKALENGVVHYADTSEPGQNGNMVIVGHSSNNIFNKGKYKFAFVLLNRLETGDTFYLQKDGKRYTYQIYTKKIVKPEDISVLGPTEKTATVSLITCDPPGTSLNRLVVIGEQISPNPSSNSGAPSATKLAAQTRVIPGNAPSLWSRLWDWFSR